MTVSRMRKNSGRTAADNAVQIHQDSVKTTQNASNGRLITGFMPPSFRILAAAGIAVALAVAGIWTVRGSRVSTSVGEIPVCRDCNVVILAIDPLRADGLHSLGNPRAVTPTLDRLAGKGFLFTNAFSVSSWTLPAAMSLMTGTYPSEHGIINKELLGATKEEGLIPASLDKTHPDMYTMASLLKSKGYATGGFAGGAALDPSYGFNRGFDTYSSEGEFEGLPSVFPKALSFIKASKDKPFFVFIHGFDVHGQYLPPGGLKKTFVDPAYGGMLTGSTEEQKALREEGVIDQEVHLTPQDVRFLRAVYDEKMADADRAIGDFLAEYGALGIHRKTVFIFTSNHGEEFYEHGRIDHGMTLFDEVIHVPLIISVQGADKAVRVTQQVRTVDIMPTLLDLLGISVSPDQKKQMRGVSLAPAMRGHEQHLDLYAETEYRYATFERAMRSWDGWKLIEDENQYAQHLYNLKKDPEEHHDVAKTGNPAEDRLMTALIHMAETMKSQR